MGIVHDRYILGRAVIGEWIYSKVHSTLWDHRRKGITETYRAMFLDHVEVDGGTLHKIYHLSGYGKWK